MPQPKYNINDRVCLRESATQTGLIEVLTISSRFETNGGWMYGIGIPGSASINSSFGDRIVTAQSYPRDRTYPESAFVSYADALDLAEAYLADALAKIRDLQSRL